MARALVSRRPDKREPTEKALAAARTFFRRIRGLAGDTALLWYPPYDRSDGRMPEHDIPYPGEHPAWLAQPPPPDDGPPSRT